MRSTLRIPALLILIGAVFACAGCLVVDAKLDEKGGGTLKLQITRLDESGDQRMRRELASPSVKLLNASYSKGVGTYEISFTDASKLRTAPLFSNLRLEQEGLDTEKRTLVLKIPRRARTKDEVDLPPDDYVVMDLTVTVPGSLVETNGKETPPSQANWKFRVQDLLGDGWLTAKAVYDVDAVGQVAPTRGDG